MASTTSDSSTVDTAVKTYIIAVALVFGFLLIALIVIFLNLIRLARINRGRRRALGMQVGPWHAYNEWFAKVPTVKSITPVGANQASVSVYYPPGTLQLDSATFNQNEMRGIYPSAPQSSPPQPIQLLQQSPYQDFYKLSQSYSYYNPPGLTIVE